MNEPENIDFTVVITDEQERCRSGTAGEAPAPRLSARVKLAALWNLLFSLVAGVPYVFLMSWVEDDFGGGAAILGGLLFACAHTAASAVSFRHYRRKYDAPVWKFVWFCVLPLLVLGGVSFLTACAFKSMEALYFLIFALCYGGYSVVYGVLLSAVLGIAHAVRTRRRSEK